MKRYLHSRAFGLLVVIVAGCVIAIAWWPGLPTPPEPPPPPPDRLNLLAGRWVDWLSPKVVWVLTGVFLCIWGVLNWQRRIGESAAARWLRRFMLTLWVFCLTLGAGRSALQEWLTIGFSITMTLITAAALGLVAAVGVTYGWPLFKCRGGRCEVKTLPAVDGTVLPHPQPYRGNDRRSGKDRRANWRPQR